MENLNADKNGANPAKTEFQQAKNLFQIVFENIQLPLSIIAYIILVGFLVVASALRETTTLSPFNVLPQYFIGWGLLFLARFLLFRLLPIFVAIYALLLIGLSLQEKIEHKQFNFPKSASKAQKLMIMPNILSIGLLLLALGYLLQAAIGPEGIFSSANSSGQANPSSKISIIFKEDIDPSVWHISLEPGQNRRSRPLSIIVEYADSLLVKDETTGAVVQIKNDMIAGVVDDTGFAPTPVAAPAVSPTSTPSTP